MIIVWKRVNIFHFHLCFPDPTLTPIYLLNLYIYLDLKAKINRTRRWRFQRKISDVTNFCIKKRFYSKNYFVNLPFSKILPWGRAWPETSWKINLYLLLHDSYPFFPVQYILRFGDISDIGSNCIFEKKQELSEKYRKFFSQKDKIFFFLFSIFVFIFICICIFSDFILPYMYLFIYISVNFF